MPKHDFMTPKAISNRMKSVGLQKLRWYCQMCQKQCRDENGFKCHITSEGHLRQMRLFSEKPGSFIDEFSREFERGYLRTLSHSHGTKRVLANKVYQEYIADKHHVHMNATCWTSLTGLCKYLGKEGKCVVDETEKGWYIQYIDRDPKTLARQQQAEQRQQAELDEEERNNRMIERQIAEAEKKKLESSSDVPAEEDELVNESVKVELNLKSSSKKRELGNVFETGDDSAPLSKRLSVNSSSSSSSAVGLSALDKIMLNDERKRAQQLQADDVKDRKDHWLHPGIVVRVMNKKLCEGKYFKSKGVVENVIDRYVGDVRVDDALLRLDQEDLETVIPKVGQKVLIVNGRGRGRVATLVSLQTEQYQCTVRVSLNSGKDRTVDPLYDDREISEVDYEDVSKLANVDS